ncbi:MAG TPA: hypothetical protein VHL11_09330 [Phototrophicaceae bacterium]|jgi:hypothetical protein|nr:hypothetical protein [Phototrophicaceae bacterium]
MQTKPKRTIPSEWQTRLLDALNLSVAFEVKVDLNADDCADYLAREMSYLEPETEYVFEIDKNSPQNNFRLIQFACNWRTQKKRRLPGHLIGYLKEEVNLEVTTVFGKVYPDIFWILVWVLLTIQVSTVYRLVVNNPMMADLRCLFILAGLWGAVLIVIVIKALRRSRQLKNHFLSRLEDLAITSDH